MISTKGVDRILAALANTKVAPKIETINRHLLLSKLQACEELFWRNSDASQRLTKPGLASLRALQKLLDKEVTRRTLKFTGFDAGAVEQLREHLSGYLAICPSPKDLRAISPKERLIGADLARVWREAFQAEPTTSFDRSKKGGARYRPTPFAEFVRATLTEMGFARATSYSQIAQCVRDKGQRRASRDRKHKR